MRESITDAKQSVQFGMVLRRRDGLQDDVMAALKNGWEVKVLCRADDRNLKR